MEERNGVNGGIEKLGNGLHRSSFYGRCKLLVRQVSTCRGKWTEIRFCNAIEVVKHHFG